MLSQQELELASEQQRQPCRLQRHTVVMPQGLDASSLTWTGLDCAALCGGDERWGKGRGVRLIRSVSPHPLPAFPIYHFEDKDSHTKRCPQHQCLHPLRGKVQSLREKTKLNSFSVLLLSPPSTPHCPLPVGWSYDIGLRTHCNNPHSVCSIPVWGEQLMILGLFSWILWHDDMDFFLHFEIWNPNIWLSFWGNSHPLPWQDDPFGRLHYLKLNVCQHALQHHSYKNCCLYFSPAPLQDRLLKDMMPRTSIMHQVFLWVHSDSDQRELGTLSISSPALFCSHAVSEHRCDSVDVWPGSHDILPAWKWITAAAVYFISTSISLLHPQLGISFDIMWSAETFTPATVLKIDSHRPSHSDHLSGL